MRPSFSAAIFSTAHPVPDLGGSLRPLRVPQMQPVGEIFHLLRICPGDLPPGLLLPYAHADLPQVAAPVERQFFGDVNGGGGGAGAVEVAGVYGIDVDVREPPLQSPDLLLAQVGEDTVVLALGNAVEVALSLRMPDEIEFGHECLPGWIAKDGCPVRLFAAACRIEHDGDGQQKQKQQRYAAHLFPQNFEKTAPPGNVSSAKGRSPFVHII